MVLFVEAFALPDHLFQKFDEFGFRLWISRAGNAFVRVMKSERRFWSLLRMFQPVLNPIDFLKRESPYVASFQAVQSIVQAVGQIGRGDSCSHELMLARVAIHG